MMESNKDVIIDFPKIMQKYMDNRDNRRSYSRPVYLCDKHDWQDGGDYEKDSIVFKRKTDYKDKNGKEIFEWDYVSVDGRKCLITLNAGVWEYTTPDSFSDRLSCKQSQDLEIIDSKEFNGKIVIKGINALEKNITNMALWASAIIDEYQNIRNGSKQ